MNIFTPTKEPEVQVDRLPRTDVQGVRLGVISAHLLAEGYTLRPIPPERRAGLPEGVICGVLKGESPVAFLIRSGDQEVGFILSELGLQFSYDLSALIKSDHWPKPGPLFEPSQNWVKIREDVLLIWERATRLHRATDEHEYLVMDLDYIAGKAQATLKHLDAGNGPDDDAPAAVAAL